MREAQKREGAASDQDITVKHEFEAFVEHQVLRGSWVVSDRSAIFVLEDHAHEMISIFRVSAENAIRWLRLRTFEIGASWCDHLERALVDASQCADHRTYYPMDKVDMLVALHNLISVVWAMLEVFVG